MDASTLNCPMCGAPSTSESTSCNHCGARLAKVACPSCFGMIFTGSKFCQHCGTKVAHSDVDLALSLPCPRCRITLTPVQLGGTPLLECSRCSGLWIDTETFNQICADREKQAAVIGQTTAPRTPIPPETYKLDSVRYAPCPRCSQLMNRLNFARSSGVILDICKQDGVWFDRDELQRIVEFIRSGGLEVSRARDREAWESEKRMKEFSPSGCAGARVGWEGSAPDLRDAFDAGSAILDVLVFVARLFLK